MALQTPTTTSITSTKGKVITNKPVNPQTVVSAITLSTNIPDGRDRNQYPAIKIEIEDDGTFYWYYNIGDEATRDADYALLDAAINPPSNSSPILYDAVVDAAGGGDYTTLEAARTAGACSIFVKNGTYNETSSITLGNNCSIYGESTGVIISYASGEGIVVDGGGADKVGSVDVTNGSDVLTLNTGSNFAISDENRTVLIGLDFFIITEFISTTQIRINQDWQGDTTTDLDYVIRDYTSGVVIDTVRVIGGGGASSPISLTNALSCSIRNVYVEGGGEQNILLLRSGRIALENVITKGATIDGIQINNSVGVKASKTTASNCVVNGVRVTLSKGISISQSFSSNNGDSGFKVTGSADDIVVDNVNGSYNNTYGIDVDATGENVVISNSICIANGDTGIRSRCERAIITGNNVKGKGKAVASTGIVIDDGTGRVVGNYVEECLMGYSIASPTAGSNLSSNEAHMCETAFACQDADNSYIGNIASDFGIRGFWVTGTNNTLTGNRAYGGTTAGNNGFELGGTGNLLVGNISYDNVKGYRVNANDNRLLSNEANNNSQDDYSINGSVTTITFDTRTTQTNIDNTDSPYTTAAGEVVLGDATGGNITVNLPAALPNKSRTITINKIDASANTITIDGNGAETIDGATTQTLTTQYETITIISDGSNWFKV